MTDDKILTEYLSREKAAMSTMRGADHIALLHAVANDAGVTFGHARRIVHAAIFTTPN